MKGFPNQIAEFEKLAKAMDCLAALVDAGKRARDDGVFGQALVRAGVAGTGHIPKPVEDYIAEQLENTPPNQSFRTTARGLRELFGALGLIEYDRTTLTITATGRTAASFAGKKLDAPKIEFWRRTVQNLRHDGGDGVASHPYQVLLRLIARKPGITRAKCALALEARDDSAEELDRIVALADLREDQIRSRISVSKSNWDNAKKVIPKFAEQLGDVIKTGQSYRLADAPGRGDRPPVPPTKPPADERAPRPPRSSRRVTPDTIGTAGLAERDEPPVPGDLDPAAAARAIRIRQERTRRHQLLVRSLAGQLADAGMTLYEDPFDTLAIHRFAGFLIEVKTLDGTESDERDRVMESLSQLLYYEAFVTSPIAGATVVHKIAFFERPITEAHQKFLNRSGIGTIWMDGGSLAGDAVAASVLGPYLKKLG